MSPGFLHEQNDQFIIDKDTLLGKLAFSSD